MTELEILDMASQLPQSNDGFSQWAACHIHDSIKEWTIATRILMLKMKKLRYTMMLNG